MSFTNIFANFAFAVGLYKYIVFFILMGGACALSMFALTKVPLLLISDDERLVIWYLLRKPKTFYLDEMKEVKFPVFKSFICDIEYPVFEIYLKNGEKFSCDTIPEKIKGYLFDLRFTVADRNREKSGAQ